MLGMLEEESRTLLCKGHSLMQQNAVCG